MAKPFHFDCGNSTDGSVGFCAVVRADSAEGAVELLKERLPSSVRVRPLDGQEEGEYIEVYFNGDKITVSDISGG